MNAIRDYLRRRDADADAQLADMQAATAGSTHPDAILAQGMIALARTAGPEKRKYFLRRAWDHTKDYVNSRGMSKGGIEGARKKKETAAEWQIKILPSVKRWLKAGKTNADIAGRIFLQTGQTKGTVEKYVAKVRKGGQKK